MSSYATPGQRTSYGIKAAAFASFTSPEIQAALDARSAFADGFLRQHYRLPLVSYGVDLSMLIVHLTDYDLLAMRGFAPEGLDVVVKDRYEAALQTLRSIGRPNGWVPDVVDSASGATDAATSVVPRVISSTGRGFSRRGDTDDGADVDFVGD